jgi:GAF domain-containing protein
MTDHQPAIDPDVALVQSLDAVPRILDAVAQLTGMRFAAIARVTESRWTACAVRDDLEFGLAPGGELGLETTICNEIRQHHQPVVFGDVKRDPVYSQHHTPKHYGLESYISVPIFRRNGEFFGTLCAIDSRPSALDDPAIVRSLQLFAEMLGLQLEMADTLRATLMRLRDATFRETLLAGTEQDIRSLIQPMVTYLYLLGSSATLGAEDRKLVAELETSCKQLTDLLRQQLDAVFGRIELQLGH